jgi:hypothetical protein
MMRLRQWRKRCLPSSSVASEYRGSYIVRVSSDTGGFATLRVSKSRTAPLHPQSDGTAERYIKTIEEQLRKVVASHQSDWDARLPIFLLAYTASTHDITGLTPASLVFGRELRLPCPATCCSGHLQTRNDPQSIMRQT